MMISTDEQVKAMTALHTATLSLAQKMKSNLQNSFSIFTFQAKGLIFAKDVFYVVFQNTSEIKEPRNIHTKVMLVIANTQYAIHSSDILSKLKEYFPKADISLQKDIPSGLH